MTLQEAIDQLVNLGYEDPLTIAKQIETKHDQDWLAAELLAHGEDIIADMARRTIGSQRRSAAIALRPGDIVKSAEFKLRSVWVPGKGWTKASEITSDDSDKIARWYRNLAGTLLRYADWWEQIGAEMREAGVKQLGQLKAALPPLPELEEAA